MASKSSAELRLQGDQLYKAGKFEEAIAQYNAALELDPQDSVLYETLSSAKFEVGRYKECIDVIEKALKGEMEEDKKRTLRLRQAKAYFYERDFERAKRVFENGAETNDEELKGLLKAIEGHEKAIADEKEKGRGWAEFLEVPRFRSAFVPGVSEFFPKGHDEPEPAFTMNELFEMGSKDPINLSIFYGGAGDGRHFMQQMYHIKHFTKKWKEKLEKGTPGEKPKFHFVFNDIKEHVLARLLIFLRIFHELSQTPDRGNEHKDSKKRTLLLGTIVYLFTADIYPKYVRVCVRMVLTDILKNKNDGFGIPGLQVRDELTKTKIIEVLEYWLKDGEGCQFKADVDFHQSRRPGKSPGAELFSDLRGPSREMNQWETSRVMLPYWALMDAYDPELKKLLEKNKSKSPNALGILLKKYALKNWYPNITLLQDPDWLDDGMDHMLTTSHIGDTIEQIFKANKAESKEFHESYVKSIHSTRPECDLKKAPGQSTFTLMQTLLPWFSAISAVFEEKDLLEISMEMRLDDCTHHLDTYVAGKSPENRTLFDAIYLSNIPDYIGGNLMTTLYALPALKHATGKFQPYAVTRVLLNTGSFTEGVSRLMAEYLCLPDLETAKKAVGMGLQPTKELVLEKLQVEMMGMPEFFTLLTPHRWIKEKADTLLDKGSFSRWLIQTFFKIALPTPREYLNNMMGKIMQPLTLTNFVRLCIYLVGEQGYPSHWVAGVIDDLLKGEIKTSVSPATSAPMKISEVGLNRSDTSGSTKYKMRALLPELRSLLIQSRHILPFVLTTPLPTISSLRKYTVDLDMFVIPFVKTHQLLSLAFFPADKQRYLDPNHGGYDAWLRRQCIGRNGKAENVVFYSTFKWKIIGQGNHKPGFPPIMELGRAEWIMEKQVMDLLVDNEYQVGIVKTDDYTLMTDEMDCEEVEEAEL